MSANLIADGQTSSVSTRNVRLRTPSGGVVGVPQHDFARLLRFVFYEDDWRTLVAIASRADERREWNLTDGQSDALADAFARMWEVGHRLTPALRRLRDAL